MNILHQYMENRFSEKDSGTKSRGPIITISREYGCPGKPISKKLLEKLNNFSTSKESKSWSLISKEIIEKSAIELNVQPAKVQNVIDNEQKTAIDEIIASFGSKYYKSDRKIRNTIANVILSYANLGNVIILGAGGVLVTKDLSNSFHFRLQAPLHWRVERICCLFNISKNEAQEKLSEIDEKRKQMRLDIKGNLIDDSAFNMIFSCHNTSEDEIVNSIFNLLKARNLV